MSACATPTLVTHRTVQSLVKAVVDKWGGVDVLVNNAGGGGLGTIEEGSSGDWDRGLGGNVKVPLDSRSCGRGGISLIWGYRCLSRLCVHGQACDAADEGEEERVHHQRGFN